MQGEGGEIGVNIHLLLLNYRLLKIQFLSKIKNKKVINSNYILYTIFIIIYLLLITRVYCIPTSSCTRYNKE